MSMSDIREELSLVLGRWHDAVREAASLPQLDEFFPEWHLSDPKMVFWIHCCNLETSDREHQQLQLEGLELLARLSLVDWKLCRDQIGVVWGKKARVWRELFRARKFRVGIDLCFNLDTSGNMMDDYLSQLCERVVTKDHMRTQSVQFEHACALIASLAATECGQVACVDAPPPIVPVRLYQYFAEESEFDATNLLFRLLQLAITQRVFHDENDEPDGENGATPLAHTRLRITHIQLNLHHSQLDRLGLRYVEQIRSKGITICDLPILNTSELTVYQNSFVRSMQSLLLTSCDEPQYPQDPPVRSQGIDVIMLSDSLADESLPGMLSAVHDGTSLRAVRVDFSSAEYDESSALFWRWLAFGLFSRPQNSKQHIQEMIMFVGELRMHHVDVMRRVFSADRPLAVLYEEAISTEECVTTSSPVLLNDPSGEEEQLVQSNQVFDPPQQHLEVINRSNDEYVSVLLPGWGKAWVRCCDAITVPPPVYQGSPSVQSIPHLVFKFLKAASTPAFLALLQLIGHDVRSLLVDDLFPDASFDELCAQVFQTCPHLESLELKNGPLASVQPLLDGYLAGTCRLRRLVFVNVTIQDGHELDPIFIALRGKGHPIATNLQELEYMPSGLLQGQSVRQKTVDLASRMLKANGQLRLLDLDFIGRVVSLARANRIRRVFTKLDKVKLPVRLAPMAMRRKWAFLSVVSRAAGAQQSETPEKAIHQLDAGVVSVIFQLAAKCCTRRVHVAMPISL